MTRVLIVDDTKFMRDKSEKYLKRRTFKSQGKPGMEKTPYCCTKS